MRRYHFDGKRVSKAWFRVLTRAREDGIAFRVNSGKRTMREQWALWRNYRTYGWPTAAFPSPFAPHIRRGRPDHALDVESSDGGETRLQNYLARKGVRTTNPVRGESWHLEAVRADLLKRYRKLQRGIDKRRRRRH